MSPGSLMPPYPWMATNELNTETLPAKIRALQKLGVPYPNGYDALAIQEYQKQASKVVENLKEAGVEVAPNTEIVALIAYLQRLGTDIRTKN
jgi:cytochrome c oxidase cbb3-type subunit I/II